MVISTNPHTVDEFLSLTFTLDDNRILELINGEIIEVSPSKAIQSTQAALLLVFLGGYVLQNDLGYFTGADGGFKLSHVDFFAPDVAFVSKARLPDGLPDDDFFSVPPDLAVEVVSKSDQGHIHEKALRYLELGTNLVWVIYPHTQTVQVYRPAEQGALVRVLKINDSLDGENVLPGFSLPLRDIFRE